MKSKYGGQILKGYPCLGMKLYFNKTIIGGKALSH